MLGARSTDASGRLADALEVSCSVHVNPIHGRNPGDGPDRGIAASPLGTNGTNVVVGEIVPKEQPEAPAPADAAKV